MADMYDEEHLERRERRRREDAAPDKRVYVLSWRELSCGCSRFVHQHPGGIGRCPVHGPVSLTGNHGDKPLACLMLGNDRAVAVASTAECPMCQAPEGVACRGTEYVHDVRLAAARP